MAVYPSLPNRHKLFDFIFGKPRAAFGGDKSRKRTENALVNFSLINKTALTFLKNELH